MIATEKRLIDANALIESGHDVTLDEVLPNWAELPASTKEAVCKHGQYLKKLINEQPTVDAVVLPCKIGDKVYRIDKGVLCTCRANIVEVLKYDSTMDDWNSTMPERCYMKGFVTHWMPLPEPPKTE